jgi:hypothetical protein
MIEIVPIADAPMPPLARTARGFAVVRNAEVLAHAGVYLDRDRYVMYGACSAAGLRERRSLIRCWRRLIAVVREKGIPIHALADPSVKRSARFLEHFGFRKLAGNLYQWEGD